MAATAPAEVPAARGGLHAAPQPASQTANNRNTDTGSTISDIAAIVLLLSGYYAFLYARRRNIGLREHRSRPVPAAPRRQGRRHGDASNIRSGRGARESSKPCRRGQQAGGEAGGAHRTGHMQPG